MNFTDCQVMCIFTSTTFQYMNSIRLMIYNFSKLLLLYVVGIWFVISCSSFVTSGYHLIAIPPIIGYIGGVAVRSTTKTIQKTCTLARSCTQFYSGVWSPSAASNNETSNYDYSSDNHVSSSNFFIPNNEYYNNHFSDHHSSISSGIGGNIDHHHHYHHNSINNNFATTGFDPDQQHNLVNSHICSKDNSYQFYNGANSCSNSLIATRKLANIAKVYHDINQHQPKEYYDYENFLLSWSKPDKYEIINKVGRGKYSEVFCGENTETEENIVIKILKPIQKQKVQREVKILKNLSGGPNIIPLLDIIKDPLTKTKSLVFPFVNSMDVRELVNYLNDHDLKYYMYELVKAIDFTHSKGIMHRDIKPHNIAIDHCARKLYLLDWGLAEFYHPHKNYSVKVASRHYKSPELLVNMYDYDYSIDMWSLGCLFAGLILNKDPFFNGENNEDQLVKIVKVLGTDDFYKYLDKYGLVLSPQLKDMIKPSVKKDFQRYIPFSNDDIAHPTAIDFLDKLLRYDPQERLTAKEALEHPYFYEFHKSINRQ